MVSLSMLLSEAGLPQGAKMAAAAPTSPSSLRSALDVLLFTTDQGPYVLYWPQDCGLGKGKW